MSNSKQVIVALGVLLASMTTLACDGAKEQETAATIAAADTVAEAATSEVQRAAAIANALSVAPLKGDSILLAHNITAAELEAMIYRIARDSTMSAEYGRLTAR